LEAAYALERRQWGEAAKLTAPEGVAEVDKAITYWARGIGAARGGEIGEARLDLAQIESIEKRQREESKTSSLDALERDRKQVLAWIEHAEGKDLEAVARLGALAKEEDGVSDVSDQIPRSEMLGDMLLDLKRPEEALAQYKADLTRNPNRLNALRGAAQAAESAGLAAQASQYRAELVKLCSASRSERCQIAESHSSSGVSNGDDRKTTETDRK
jgi:hypothetical protein